ncbi:MAG: putative transport system permease protein [Chloroflexia bacterium]|jgi:putative ABC transport system permease protein|nr:putative transport system permease protein [Chloroflexia bacterium]
MGAIKRGAQNVLRSPVRLVLVVLLLGTSMAFAAAMLTLNTAIGESLQQVRGNLGTNIQLRPAGSFGPFGTGETLAQTDLDKVAKVDGVVKVSEQLSVQYTGTDLQPVIPQFTGGRGQGQNQDGGNGGNAGGQGQDQGGGNRRGFLRAMVQVTGVEGDASQVSLLGGGTVQLVNGRNLSEADANANVAMIGQALADANGVKVGSQLNLEGTPVEIVGTFTTGQRFGDNSLLMPISTVQRLYQLEGQVTQATVQVNSMEQVQPVADQLGKVLDVNNVDIVTDAQIIEATNRSLQGVQGSTQTGLIVSVLTAALVIVFAVILVVRERKKEIGILKAIGASNTHVIGQFAVEILTLSLASALVAFGVLAVAGQTIASQFALRGPGQGGGFGRFAGGFAGNFAGVGAAGRAGNVLASSSGLSVEALVLVLGLGVVLAVLASVIPAWQVARIKPAEVLRFA